MLPRIKYTPVLRWKMAEWLAIGSLADSLKAYVLPLIEIPPSRFYPPKGKTSCNIDASIEKIIQELEKNWSKRPFFLDTHLLNKSNDNSDFASEILDRVWQRCNPRTLLSIPVTGLERNREYQEIIRRCVSRCGSICVRMNLAKSMDQKAITTLETFLDTFGLQPENIYLLLDFGYFTDSSISFQPAIRNYCQGKTWRHTIICAGSFPVDLTHIPIGNHEIPRLEWREWQNQFPGGKSDQGIIFGDYTIQHPIFKEPSKGVNPSASIRYTLSDSWMIFRGEGLKTSELGHEQYIGHAQLLIDDDFYYGSRYSTGDQYISDIANGDDGKPGNPRTWLQAGINHHMTVVLHQLV